MRPDGKISMPLLNDIPAAGLTPLQLKDSITEKLKKFIADPRVTVVVTAMNSQRIFVSGEVLHSGPMPLLPHMTMLQALVAGGLHPIRQSEGDLPAANREWQTGKNTVQLQGSDQRQSSRTEHYVEAGRYGGGPVRNAMSKLHDHLDSWHAGLRAERSVGARQFHAAVNRGCSAERAAAACARVWPGQCVGSPSARIRRSQVWTCRRWSRTRRR